VKGEFENRLKNVINEVKASPKPIVLFIDEAHTIIGAGGAQGGSDAANLLKPALARGELRTIAATTWAEYKKYFEKDAALERRFQPVKVDEPSEENAVLMLRGLRAVFEKAHNVVTIRDEAIVAAVKLSAPLHLRPAAARQGRRPARHRHRAREDQPRRQARRPHWSTWRWSSPNMKRERDALERDRASGFKVDEEHHERSPASKSSPRPRSSGRSHARWTRPSARP
jgi:type VI secretion system protein VasG